MGVVDDTVVCCGCCFFCFLLISNGGILFRYVGVFILVCAQECLSLLSFLIVMDTDDGDVVV